jgi:hypothetical protein
LRAGHGNRFGAAPQRVRQQVRQPKLAEHALAGDQLQRTAQRHVRRHVKDELAARASTSE